MRANKTTFPPDAHPRPMSQPGFQPRLQHPPQPPFKGGRALGVMWLAAGCIGHLLGSPFPGICTWLAQEPSPHFNVQSLHQISIISWAICVLLTPSGFELLVNYLVYVLFLPAPCPPYAFFSVPVILTHCGTQSCSPLGSKRPLKG